MIEHGIMFLLSIILLLSSGAPAPCSPILPPQPESPGCIQYGNSFLDDLKLVIKSSLEFLQNVTGEINNTASFLPTCLSFTQNDTGNNFLPVIQRDDFHGLGHAGRVLQKCVFPIISNLTYLEYERQMEGKVEHYATKLHAIVGEIPLLVARLNNLTRSDINLSEGSMCSITEVTCTQPTYPEMRSSDPRTPFSPNEDRLRKIINTSRNIKTYVQRLRYHFYWSSST